MHFKTDYIRRIGKKMKSKRGTTLIEMIATVAILSIVATMSLQAVFIANEEYKRVNNMSVSQRSVSLMQENFNVYLKNAVEVELLDYAGDGAIVDINDSLTTFIADRNSSTEEETHLSDSEYTVTPGEYDDYVLYRSGTFRYTLAKYYVKYPPDPSAPASQNNVFVPLFNVDNVKEINFSLRTLSSTSDTGGNVQYMLDYIVTSPTNKEIIFLESQARSSYIPDENEPWNYHTDFKTALKDNLNKGDYNILTGTIINNMYGSYSTAVTSLRISEGMTDAGNFDGSHKNFVFIRTMPRVAV